MAFALFIVMLLVMFLRPFDFFFPESTEIRYVLLFAVVAFAAGILDRLVKQQKDFDPLHLVLIAGLTLAIFLSNLIRGWIGGAVSGSFEFMVSVVYFVLVGWQISTLKRLRVSMMIFVVCATLLMLLSIYSYHTGYMIESLVTRQSVSGVENAIVVSTPADDISGHWLWRIRSLGMLNDPNDFAQFIIVSLVFSWGLVVSRKAFFLKAVFVPFLGLCAYSIYLTHSRGALLGFCSAVFMLAVKRYGIVRPILFALPVLITASGLSVGGESRGFNAGEESAGGRIEAWSAGLSMLAKSPIFGIGYGGFLDHHHYTAHNSFVLCFAELGLFGYFVWLGLIVACLAPVIKFILGARLRDKDQLTEATQLMMIAGISTISYLACAFFLSRSYQPTLYIILAMCVASFRIHQHALEHRDKRSESIASQLKSRVTNQLESQLRRRGIVPVIGIKQWATITLLCLVSSLIGFIAIVKLYWRVYGS